MPACQFCEATDCPYVCPKCSAPYCTLKCYRSEKHIGCTEQFYKQCVEETLKTQHPDSETSRKVREALVRDHQAAVDEEVLVSRLNDVDLEDAEAVEQALTEEQKTTFDRLLHTNEIADFVTLWKPWWFEKVVIVPQEVQKPAFDKGFNRVKKVQNPKLGGRKVKFTSKANVDLVTNPQEAQPELVSKHAEPTETHSEIVKDPIDCRRTLIIDPRHMIRSKLINLNSIDPIDEDSDERAIKRRLVVDDKVPLLDDLIGDRVTNVRCSNVSNIIVSFAFIIRYYNGSFDEELVVEAGSVFQSICRTLQQKDFQTVSSAVADVLSSKAVVENGDPATLLDDLRHICQRKHFVIRALIESRDLLRKNRKALKSSPGKTSEIADIRRKQLKIEYFLEWSEQNFAMFSKVILPTVELMLHEVNHQ